MDGLEFKVLRADRRRIDQLRVTTPVPVPARPGEPRLT
jgi:Mg2+/Co2+ transporter CorC